MVSEPIALARLATKNESQTRRAKALRLALVFLPIEYLYFFALPEYLALRGSYGITWLFGIPMMIGTIIFLLSYSMVPASEPA